VSAPMEISHLGQLTSGSLRRGCRRSSARLTDSTAPVPRGRPTWPTATDQGARDGRHVAALPAPRPAASSSKAGPHTRYWPGQDFRISRIQWCFYA
jgi:hypothetical protein